MTRREMLQASNQYTSVGSWDRSQQQSHAATLAIPSSQGSQALSPLPWL